MALNRVRNIHLSQNHQVIVPDLHGPDGLGEAESMAVPDILSSKVYP